MNPELINIYPALAYFNYQRLPAHLQSISKPFAQLAYDMAGELPINPETDMMIRKLLEAKDCAVRAELTAVTRKRQTAEHYQH